LLKLGEKDSRRERLVNELWNLRHPTPCPTCGHVAANEALIDAVRNDPELRKAVLRALLDDQKAV